MKTSTEILLVLGSAFVLGLVLELVLCLKTERRGIRFIPAALGLLAILVAACMWFGLFGKDELFYGHLLKALLLASAAICILMGSAIGCLISILIARLRERDDT